MIFKTKQLGYWEGEFGSAYSQRNADLTIFAKRKKFFKYLLIQYPDIQSVLEVGCNIGGNLFILGKLKPELKLFGIEPNRSAINTARNLIKNAYLTRKNASEIKEKDTYDLVFTSGVLIHIADTDLPKTFTNMYNASKKYLLTVEYYATTRIVIPYRGLTDALFKRPYDKEWLTIFPNLKLMEKGILDKSQGFDNCHWWLFRKN